MLGGPNDTPAILMFRAERQWVRLLQSMTHRGCAVVACGTVPAPLVVRSHPKVVSLRSWCRKVHSWMSGSAPSRLTRNCFPLTSTAHTHTHTHITWFTHSNYENN